MYDMQPPQPVQMPGPVEKKRMSVPQIMLIVLVIAFAVWYLVTALTPESASFATITADTVGFRYSGDCLIVRDEIPYDDDSVGNVEYIAEEGSYVSRGVVVCKVYTSGFDTRETETLQTFRDNIKEYQLKLLQTQSKTEGELAKLASDVLTCAREVRELVGGARGNMHNQEVDLKNAIRKRQEWLKNKYNDDQRMSRLYDDEQGQLQRISSWTKQRPAEGEGLVSFYSDGYEYGLTMSNFDQFTPAQVRSMLNGQKPEGENALAKGKTTVYRLVRNGHWVVLMLIRDSNWNPVEGAEYELKLENFKDTMVRAKVLSFTRTGGELEVRLDVQSDVTPVLYIRTCPGVLGDSVSNLCVPARALYTQDNMPGVVVVNGEYNVFIPVNVIDKRDGMVYISPIQAGVLNEGQTVRLF